MNIVLFFNWAGSASLSDNAPGSVCFSITKESCLDFLESFILGTMGIVLY